MAQGSDTFKFYSQVTDAGSQGSAAAQKFLSQKMAKNQFLDTLQPIENVGKYVVSDPYAYGEGTLPGGEGYADQFTITNQDEIDKWHEENPDFKAKKGKWQEGKLSAEEIREKWGLDYNEDHAKQSHSNVQKGSAVANTGALYVKGDYIGTIKGFSPQDPDNLHPGAGGIAPLQAIDQYAYDNGLKSWMSSGWNSYNDVAGAVRAVYGEGTDEKPPEPEMAVKPIEHSAEIVQAKERVKNYEQEVESGELSTELFGNSSLMDKYQQDFTTGSKGIGTNVRSASQQKSLEAAQSFLDNKVSKTKKQVNFKPA